jgi:hypothetical protein
MRELMRVPQERALAQRAAQIDAFFDQQIEEARRSQPAEQLGTSIASLMKARADAKASARQEIVGAAGYVESYSVTLENDLVQTGEAEVLFASDGFPQGGKAVNMVARSTTLFAQIQVALANANPYAPQLEVDVWGDEPGWVEGSFRSMQEIVERGQPSIIRHWRWWIQPVVIPVFTWAFFSWFLAALIEFYRVPVLLKYPWLAIFAGALPAGGVLQVLQRAIPPFAVYRTGEGFVRDVVRGLLIVVLGALLLWLLGRIGLWFAARTS